MLSFIAIDMLPPIINCILDLGRRRHEASHARHDFAFHIRSDLGCQHILIRYLDRIACQTM